MKMIELRELGSFRNGLNFAKSEARGKGCKILGVGDFGNATFIHASSLEEINENLVSEEDLISDDDILFVRSNGNKALVGRMLFAQEISEKVCYSGFCIRFRPNKEVIDPFFLFYMLKTPYCKQQYTPSQQTNINNLSQDTLGAVKIPVPDTFEEQKKRSELLRSLDGKIEVNTRVCQELESMAKTLYDYWFVQFDFPDENGKPYRSSNGKMTRSDELNRIIPCGWSIGTISDLGDIISGATPATTEERNYTKNGIAWITPNDLSENSHCMFITHGARDISEVGFNSCSTVLMPAGSVLMSSRAPIGYLAIASNEVCTNQGFKSIICNKGFGTYFVYYLLKSNIAGIIQQGVGTTFKEVSRKSLAQYKVLLPNMELVKEFETILTPWAKIRENREQENKYLVQLRDWLLPMLMNGQATVADTKNA